MCLCVDRRMRRSVTSKERLLEVEGALILLIVVFAPVISSAGILGPWGWKIPSFMPEEETRCYDHLGCLNITSSWTKVFDRPVNVFPLSPKVIDTRFLLYTSVNQLEDQILVVVKDRLIKPFNLDTKKPTKFIIHGFVDTALSKWVKKMRNELLKHGDYNVIVVDWAGGSRHLYTQATANTRLVGLEIAHLIKLLQTNYGLDVKDVHLIGHSLGAHVAGYAGEKLGGSIGRITGLDPAKPNFEYMPSYVRLDPTDAKLVDVIHTDRPSISFAGFGGLPGLPMISGLGMSEPCGHLDFYPNDGKSQPGCEDLSEATMSWPSTFMRDGLEEATRVLMVCNHNRAIELFISSINANCQYVAHECGNYDSFLRGECFSCKSNDSLSCGVMGYHADTSPALNKRQSMERDGTPRFGSKFFFSTGEKDPYCRRHYRLTINLARPPTAKTWVQGSMNVTLHADNGVIRDMGLTPSGYMRLRHGDTTKIVVPHAAGSTGNLGKIRMVELSWNAVEVVPEGSLGFSLASNDRLYVDSIVVDTMELPGQKTDTDFSSKFCPARPQEYTEIASNSTASFVDNC